MAISKLRMFRCFQDDLAKGKHDLTGDDLRVYLTNEAPRSSMVRKSDLPEIKGGAGYIPGGARVSPQYAEGVLRINSAEWTCSGGQLGPFRYAVLYNASAKDEPLIGSWDSGREVTLEEGDDFSLQVKQALLEIRVG